MKEHFRFIIEMEAEIHDSPMEPCIPEIYENVKGVALKIRSDKEMLTKLLGINFFDLLAGDYYTETLLREMGLKKEKEIILSISQEMGGEASAFFSQLLDAADPEKSKIAQDNALNMLISCIGDPEITGVKLECIDGK